MIYFKHIAGNSFMIQIIRQLTPTKANSPRISYLLEKLILNELTYIRMKVKEGESKCQKR